MASDFIKARKSQFHFYRTVPLYNKVDDEKYVLYKPAGITLGEMRMSEARHPEEFYIKAGDKIKGIQEVQKAFNQKLADEVKTGKFEEVKNTLATIMEETLTEPRSGSLEGVSETMDILSDYVSETNVVNRLLEVSSKDYSTIMHSINTMAFALKFADRMEFSKSELKVLGLAALLHDVGKTKIDIEILAAPRKLNKEEFEEMQRHCTAGHDILRACNFDRKEIRLAALEHHEKLDKSGYPNGKSNVTDASKIIGIIDCYEALTNDDRPYRSAMPAYDALNIIKKDVVAGKFDKSIFEKFAHCLAQ